jgi:deoxyribose-phosphate aldolase
LDTVRLMKKHGEGLLVKASGGIRDLATAQAMLAAGADRLGMSASVEVVEQLKKSQST